MMLPIPLLCLFSIASGQDRIGRFRKLSPYPTSLPRSGGAPTVVGCAVKCLRGGAMAFHTGTTCETFPSLCEERNIQGACYNRMVGETAEDEQNSFQATNLLIMPHMKIADSFIFNLQDKSVKEFPSISFQRIRSALFMPKSHKMLLCAGFHVRIFIWDVVTGNESTVASTPTDAMAVDEDEKVVFYIACSMSYTSVYWVRINLDSNSTETSTLLYNRLDYPKSLVVDPKNKILYTAVKNYVNILNYNGTILEVIETGTNTFAIALDFEHRLILCGRSRDLLVYDLDSKKEIRSTDIKALVKKIVYYNNTVYVGSHKGLYLVHNHTEVERIEVDLRGQIVLSLF